MHGYIKVMHLQTEKLTQIIDIRTSMQCWGVFKIKNPWLNVMIKK